MNWEPDFLDFMSTSVVTIMSPMQIALLCVTSAMCAAVIKSNKGRAFMMKAVPWKKSATEFRDLLATQLKFKNLAEHSEFDGIYTLIGKLNDQTVRVEVTSGSRGFSYFEGFTVAVIIKIPTNSALGATIFPRRIDAVTSVQGQELIRLIFMKSPDVTLFKSEVHEAIRMATETLIAHSAA